MSYAHYDVGSFSPLAPASQQVAPYLSQAGGMAAALPLMQGISQQVFGMMQGSGGAATSRDRNVREYRDVRPKKKRYSFGEGNAGPSNPGGRSTAFANDEARRRASAPVRRGDSPGNSGDSAMERIANFMGAKF